MRLDLTDKAGDRLTVRSVHASEGGLVGNVRRAEFEIKAERDSRHDDDRGDRRDAAVPERLRRRGRSQSRRLGVRRSQQPARYFDARRFRFGLADQTGGAIAVDLLQLVLIDEPVAAAAQGARLPPKRPQHGEDRRSGHHCENDPKHH